MGKVYFVGAGPGDAELLTLKACRVLREADVVLYDRLVGKEIVENLQEMGKELIYVGKTCGERGSRRQEEINKLMKKYAQEGKKVVRLKGGDPVIFGRLSDEIAFLAESGIPFEVIPGVSSINGVPAYVNIPLTHPELALCLVVITGKEKLDFGDIMKKSTFVVLMGKDSIKEVARNLVALGVEPGTGAAIIERGTLKEQKTIYTTIEKILNEDMNFEGPALIVIGKVVEFAAKIRERMGDERSSKL